MIEGDFSFLAALLKKSSGLVLQPDQVYLLEARLSPLVHQYGFTELPQLVDHLRRDAAPELVYATAEAMTVNETSFMRDTKPFDAFRRQLLPAIRKRNEATKCIRLWSAGCAAGQEAYSLLMLLSEEQMTGWKIDMIGTDLSQAVIAQAREGIYSQFDIQRGLPVQLMLKYFTQIQNRWQIHDTLRQAVQFRTQNLLDDFSGMGVFDVIFCRNVLLYMDAPSKKDILTRMAKNAHEDTALVLGASETLLQLDVPWQAGPYLPNLYCRR
jgi:chemotaxis protein methyltransferase CheR